MNNGWYVKAVLQSAESIRANLFNSHNIVAFCVDEETDETEFGANLDFDTPLYDDLLSIEIKIKDFENRGLFSDRERVIINLIITGYTVKDIAETLGIAPITVLNDLNSVSERLAFALGDHFTNEGYLRHMVSKYQLEDSEIHILQKFMER